MKEKTVETTKYGVFFVAPNPDFPPEFCEGYVYDSLDEAQEMAYKLNSSGAAGKYVAKTLKPEE